MRRNLYIARQLLEIVEENADIDGLAYSHLVGQHVGRHGTPTSEDLYQITLLTQAGFLQRSGVSGADPVMLQLTWSGHELLDKLRSEHSSEGLAS